MTWAQEFTERLLTMKRHGHAFERAWEITLRYLPPCPRRDFGIRGPWFPEGTFEAVRAEREHLAWFRGACRQAWDEEPASECLYLLRSAPILSEHSVDARGKSRIAA
jgi:hypothetical protein